jgi:hypothetical protein
MRLLWIFGHPWTLGAIDVEQAAAQLSRVKGRARTLQLMQVTCSMNLKQPVAAAAPSANVYTLRERGIGRSFSKMCFFGLSLAVTTAGVQNQVIGASMICYIQKWKAGVLARRGQFGTNTRITNTIPLGSAAELSTHALSNRGLDSHGSFTIKKIRVDDHQPLRHLHQARRSIPAVKISGNLSVKISATPVPRSVDQIPSA